MAKGFITSFAGNASKKIYLWVGLYFLDGEIVKTVFSGNNMAANGNEGIWLGNSSYNNICGNNIVNSQCWEYSSITMAILVYGRTTNLTVAPEIVVISRE